MEVFEVVLVESIADNLNVELVKVLVAERSLEVGSERGFNEDRVVQLFDVGRNAEHGHGLEPAKRVASVQKLPGISFVEGTGDEQRNVIDHVSVRQVLHELGQRSSRIGLDIAKLGDKLVGRLAGEGRGGGVGRQRC